ncbi:zinc ribbon domain-containing protein [Staphylococcus capitis]|uniref:zinc ribbon domain-containing protein n=1 Tax=Staphylococcus capitis TaxID=29388 RepID=UPI0011A4F80D|nr:zinc ribbon domain-containing protein [Staphylococcus capitis]
MNCPKCGQNIQPEDVFCGNCGTKLQSATTETTGITSSETTNKETLDKRTKETKEHVQSTLTDVNHHQNINQSVVNQNDTHHPVNQTFEQARTNEKDFLNELKEFFINAFKRPDQVIKDNQTFSFRILITLIVAGLLLISLFTTMLIPSQVGLFEIQKEDILLRFVLSLAIILAIHIGITYAVVRLTVIPEIKFNKLLSDYVIINTFTVALLIFSGIIFALNSYKFAALIFIVMYLFFTISPAYILGKYSSLYETRISSVYGVIILIFALAIIALIFGENVIESVVMQDLSRLFGRVI